MLRLLESGAVYQWCQDEVVGRANYILSRRKAKKPNYVQYADKPDIDKPVPGEWEPGLKVTNYATGRFRWSIAGRDAQDPLLQIHHLVERKRDQTTTSL